MAQMHLHVLCRYQEILSSDFPLNFAVLCSFCLLCKGWRERGCYFIVCVCVRVLVLCERMTYSYLHKFKEYRNAAAFFGE